MTVSLSPLRTLFLCLLSWLALSPVFAQEAPFRKGVNLTNWFQANSAREIPFSRYTRQDFERIKSLGCDVIRLPLNLHAMTQGFPDYTLDPLLFIFLDQAVSWAEELNLHLILDNHSFDPIAATKPEVENILVKVWTQLARHYQNRPERLYFEILNEPHGISDAQWNAIQGRVIQAIRTQDKKHTLVVGATNYNSYQNLAQLPVYADDKLIYTFHFYDPFLFTHQGGTWMEPSLGPLANMPFPFRTQDMPPFPSSLRNSWMEGAFNNYAQEGTVARVKQLIDLAARFKKSRQVPVFCGEFGVYMPNSPAQDRVFWYDVVRRYLEEKGIACTIWDYHGGFGLFTDGSQGLFQHDLNVPLLQALGLTVPPQTPYEKTPETAGFPIYTDYVARGMVNGSYGTSLFDFYKSQQPNNGRYSLSWAGAERYSSLVFDFSPNKDLSFLLQNGYALDFLFRGTAPGTNVDIRFIDTKTADPNDHPWRAGLTLSPQVVPFDGRWHHVRLPLTSFREQGSWDNNTWHTPEGKFDWANLDRLEITAEHGPLGEAKLWFDNLYISDQDTAQVYNKTVYNGSLTALPGTLATPAIKIYPNPTAGNFILETSLPGEHTAELQNSVGQVVFRRSFRQRLTIPTTSLATGAYSLKVIQPDSSFTTHKVMVQH